VNQPRILVVDDERFFQEAIRDTLAGAGYETVVVGTGEEALERALQPEIGVVVLDLELPDLHGLEVFRRISQQRSDIRVVVLSAHTDQENVLEALRLGAFDYLAKPLHEEELQLAVRRALDTHGIAAGWVRLRERIQRLEGSLAELWERAAADPLDVVEPENLRQLAVKAAAEVLGAAKTSLMLLDPTSDELQVAAAQGLQVALEEVAPVSLGEGVSGLVLARGEPVLVDHAADDPRFRDRAAPGRYQSDSFAVAPLRAGERMIGVLCATERSGGGSFDEEDLALLRILASQVARMLDGEALPAIPTDEEMALEVFPDLALPDAECRADLAREICDAVTNELEPGRILEGALRVIGDRLGASPVSLYLCKPGTPDLLLEAQWDGGSRSDRPRLEPGGLTGRVLTNGQLVASPQPDADPLFDAEVDTPEDGRSGPFVCGPVRFRGKSLGVYRVFPEDPDAAQPATGEVLTAALSAAVRNVLLYRSLVESIEEVAAARREAQQT
jgi:DNA-binding response OmpR family regulator